jgi:signal transduction histidine kinase
VQAAVWPNEPSSGGVWLFAMILACYSLGAHARGRAVALGALAPLGVVLAADLPTRTGWGLVNGVLFVTAFIGVLPTTVGRLLRERRDRLAMLDEQASLILREQVSATESAVLAERLRATERLRPALLDGMRSLAQAADAGVEPGRIERTARDLLARTREEVLALTAPVEARADALDADPPDHVRTLREAAQPWASIAGGAVAVGFVLESVAALPTTVPHWADVLAALAVGTALALVWWRPLAAVAVGWAAAAAFSFLASPLDGTLSESTFALCSAFAVGALARLRTQAAVGLLVCWLGQLMVGADDPIGEAAIVLVCWLGGLAVNEATRLVEQGKAYNRLLAEQDAAAAQRAVVDERLRLARELHDQIGHSLTVVALQAGAARRLALSDPDQARSLLLTIATAARDGLTALDGAQTPADLDSLLRVTRAAGLPVDAHLGDWATLDPQRQTVVHRLIQEALTNVLRHAPGATATVAIRRAGDEVVITIANSAPTRPGSGSGTGRGLIGIRERVTRNCGRVEWGPRPDGGFHVKAMLPVALEGATE